nr:MAG TPA: hypothetical protein [Caudoviricetes sp.]
MISTNERLIVNNRTLHHLVVKLTANIQSY